MCSAVSVVMRCEKHVRTKKRVASVCYFARDTARFFTGLSAGVTPRRGTLVSSWITTRSLLDASDGRPGQRFSGLISYPPEFLREPDCFAVRSRHLERWLGVSTPPLLSLLHMGTRYYHFREVVRPFGGVFSF